MQQPGRAQRGFTLTELMIALAIMGILAMIGAPAMGSLLARSRDADIEASIAGGMRHARTIAVMQATRVLACPSDDGHKCRPGFDWQHGWIVAPDADHDGQPDAGKPLFATQQAMPEGIHVITSVGRERIVFHPNGNAAGSNTQFTICNVHEHTGAAVVVANSGRVRVGKPEPKRLKQCLADAK